jgi:hypothetical protein
MRVNAVVRIGVSIGVSIIVGLSVGFVAMAQGPASVSLKEQLSAQYKVAKLGAATGVWTVLEPGTVLEIQKPGIAGVAPNILVQCPSKFENGSLKQPGSFCVGMVGAQNIRYLTVGEKVYPSKLDVNMGKDKVSISIFECDSCNGFTQPSSYRSEVVFQFPKGFLATASAGQVEDTIGQVLAISNETQAPQAQGGGDAQPAPEEQAEPQTIRIGQTTDQVVATLGKPQKIVDLGTKQIYIYKDMKITFVGGKVSDVQ